MKDKKILIRFLFLVLTVISYPSISVGEAQKPQSAARPKERSGSEWSASSERTPEKILIYLHKDGEKKHTVEGNPLDHILFQKQVYLSEESRSPFVVSLWGRGQTFVLRIVDFNCSEPKTHEFFSYAEPAYSFREGVFRMLMEEFDPNLIGVEKRARQRPYRIVPGQCAG